MFNLVEHYKTSLAKFYVGRCKEIAKEYENKPIFWRIRFLFREFGLVWDLASTVVDMHLTNEEIKEVSSYVLKRIRRTFNYYCDRL